MTQCPTFSLKTGLHISVQCTPHVLHRMGLPEADAVAWQCSCTQNAIEPSKLYKIMYDCSCLTRWHAHDFTYINPIIRRVSRMTLINQRHNKDRIRLRKYTSHIEVCNENNIPQWTCPVVHRTWPPIVAEGLNTHRTPSIPFHSPTTSLYPMHTLKGHYHTPSLAMDKLEYRMAILIRIDIFVEKASKIFLIIYLNIFIFYCWFLAR